MTKRYGKQDVKCEHCDGTGRVSIEWEEYIFLCLPDRLREALESFNGYRATFNDISLTWEHIARSADISSGVLEQVLEGGSVRLSLADLYKLADALEVRIEDLLPIGGN